MPGKSSRNEETRLYAVSSQLFDAVGEVEAVVSFLKIKLQTRKLSFKSYETKW